MKLEGSHVFDAPRERVWEILNDKDALQRHIPGCDSLELVGDDEFQAVMTVGVARIKGRYDAKFKITDKQAPVGYTLKIEGTGKPGFVKGEGRVTLVELDGKTELQYSGELQIGGVIASIGQRLIGGIVGRMTRQFFLDLGSEAVK